MFSFRVIFLPEEKWTVFVISSLDSEGKEQWPTFTGSCHVINLNSCKFLPEMYNYLCPILTICAVVFVSVTDVLLENHA